MINLALITTDRPPNFLQIGLPVVHVDLCVLVLAFSLLEGCAKNYPLLRVKPEGLGSGPSLTLEKFLELISPRPNLSTLEM